MTYSEKLKDPRWQKKRLEILSRDSFTCNYCGDTETTLHVHHLEYKKGLEPWDYYDEYLITICADCHECEHLKLSPLERYLINCLRRRDSDMDVNFRKSLNRIVKNFTSR